LVKRARIVLLSLSGLTSKAVGRQLKVSQPTIRLWQRRFRAGGPEALTEIAPGRGRKPKYGSRKLQHLIEATQGSPPAGQTHWSCRSFAKAHGLSKATVQRFWNLHGLKPHLQRTFKMSRDKRFVEKLTDVVGLYLNPPDKALVLCVDEKSQIQALDRTQPGLPMKRGRCGTRTHDYVRHGTTTLFAALNMLDGKVVGQCLPRHRHQEFFEVFAPFWTASSGATVLAPDRGQLRHAQASPRETMVGKASSFSTALHPNQRILDQSGGTLVPGINRQSDPPGNIRECTGPDCFHRKVFTEPQYGAQTVPLDGIG